jgi:UDP-glucose 4-epimerase
MLRAAEHHAGDPGAHVYNLGTDETIVVDDSVAVILGHLGLEPTITHTGGRRGWVGDSPLIHLDTSRIRSLGWKPELTIPEAIVRTLEWFQKSDYLWTGSEEASAP